MLYICALYEGKGKKRIFPELKNTHWHIVWYSEEDSSIKVVVTGSQIVIWSQWLLYDHMGW